MNEPTITFKTSTTHTIKVHLVASNNGGICHPYKVLARCGALLAPDVVDETTEHVNCKSCLKLAEKDAR